MARTGVNENKQAQKDYAAQGKEAYGKAQGAIGESQAGLQTLKSGRDIGANPYLRPDYLGAVNRLQGYALEGENSAAKQNIQDESFRSGGFNTSGAASSIKNMALQKMRLANQLTTQRTADDFNRNLAWQQYLQQAPLGIAGAEGGLYGTSTGGRGNALNNLTQFGIAQYGPWRDLMAGMGMAGAGALSNPAITGGDAAAAGCWIAEAIYGEHDARTHLLRAWLNGPFRKTWLGDKVMRFYLRFGERIATKVRRFRILRWALRPLFELGLIFAMRERVVDLGAMRRAGV